MEPSLTEIANEEGTDKGTEGPRPRQGHNYTDIYDSYLSPLRNKPIALLEIGLGATGPAWNADYFARSTHSQAGASLRMWHRYFPQARVLGIDVNDASFLDNDRITTGRVDQSDPEGLESFLRSAGIENLDVIIDDGSHRPDHQQISLSTLFPYLASGGMYFIEDLLDNGRGDDRSDRHSSGNVLNTRQVLREFSRTGVFPEPNALSSSLVLADSIAHVSFHCPAMSSEQTMTWPFRRRFETAAKLLLKKRVDIAVEYPYPEKNLLCLLQKN
jgi:hypothetical protein